VVQEVGRLLGIETAPEVTSLGDVPDELDDQRELGFEGALEIGGSSLCEAVVIHGQRPRHREVFGREVIQPLDVGA
jgi:hypothetical protein